MTTAPALDLTTTEQTVDLTTDELSVLLGLLNVQTIPGFTARQVPEPAYSGALHTLASRGAILPNRAGGWIVAESAAAAVTAGLDAQRVVDVRREDRYGTADDWLFVQPGFVVRYHRPWGSVHRFHMYTDHDCAARIASAVCGRTERVAFTPACLSLPPEIFEVRHLARQGRMAEADAAADFCGLPADLRDALTDPAQYAVLVGFSVHDGRVSGDGALVVTSSQPGRYWLLTPTGSRVRAERVDSSGVAARVGSLLVV